MTTQNTLDLAAVLRALRGAHARLGPAPQPRTLTRALRTDCGWVEFRGRDAADCERQAAAFLAKYPHERLVSPTATKSLSAPVGAFPAAGSYQTKEM